jgi:hypothetical protein
LIRDPCFERAALKRRADAPYHLRE